MHRFPVADLIVVIVYLAIVVSAGIWCSRESRTIKGFTAAGSRLSGWVVGLSIFGTFLSSISFLAIPGKAFAGNWNAFAFSLTLPIAAWIAATWFIPFYRRAGKISAYHHLEERFGPWARTYAVVVYLLTQLARVGSILYLVALAVSPLTGWDIPTLILVTGVLATAYTLLGGLEAVIWTDVIQSIVLLGGALIAVVFILMNLPEGPMQVFTIAARHEKFSLGSFGPELTHPTFWVVLVYGMAINLQNFGIDQSYVQRYIAARSDRAAVNSIWLGALLYVPVSALLFFIGTGLFAYYQVHPATVAAGIDLAAQPDMAFPHFIVTALPVGVTGLVVAAILAAAMSSVDSGLNSSATLLLEDIYRRRIRPNAGERESMRILYGGTLLFGVLGMATALSMMRVKNVLDVWWEWQGIFGGGLLGLFLLGFISRRVQSTHAALAVGAGVLVVLWMTLSPAWTGPFAAFQNPLHNFLIIVTGTVVILLVGVLLARFRQDSV